MFYAIVLTFVLKQNVIIIWSDGFLINEFKMNLRLKKENEE